MCVCVCVLGEGKCECVSIRFSEGEVLRYTDVSVMVKDVGVRV